MATIKTNGMPKEYTETMVTLATYLELHVYGEVKIFYRVSDDSFVGSIANRGVIFFFTVREVAEQILHGASAGSLGDIILADYRKFIPTRFIKSTKGEQ